MTVSPPHTPTSYCENCGTQLPAGATACPRCGYQIAPAAGVGPSPDLATETRADGAESPTFKNPSGPDTPVALGDGETVWRRYHVTDLPEFKLMGMSLSRATGTGWLYVTDSRLMFVANMQHRGGRRRSFLVQETQIQHITGMSAYVSRSFSIWTVVLVGLLGLLGLTALGNGAVGIGLVFFAFTAIGVLLILQGFAHRGTVGLLVHSGATQASPLGFGEVGETSRWSFLRSLMGPFGMLFASRGAHELLVALPGPNAEQVILELGALVADMQSKGNLAGTHWGVEGGVQAAPSGQ
jgi:hypothetical protein